MQPDNQHGNQPVTPSSITRFSASVPLEEQNHPATAHASGEPPPSPPLATGHIRRKIDTRYERITQALQSIGYTVRLGTVKDRLCIRTIQREGVRYAAA